MLKIVQIGAGGTGSWFARILACIICQYREKYGKNLLLDPVRWVIADYDIVEKRNLLRQPFIGGIGMNKAEFLAGKLREVFSINDVTVSLHATPYMARGDISELLGLTAVSDMSALKDDIKLIVSCVDNTFTRSIIEEKIAEYRPENTWYLNMGVSAEGDWFMERISAKALMPTIYDALTYPDAMLSCGQRAEMTPMPQTTYSNDMAGAMAAHSVAMLAADILAGKQPDEILCASGKDLECGLISPEEYVKTHAADLAAAATRTTATTEEEEANVQTGNDNANISLDDLAG